VDPRLRLLLKKLDRADGQFRHLREGIQKAVYIAQRDPEMALTRAPKVLEAVMRESAGSRLTRTCNRARGR
jgi:hypothetical protein